MEMQRKTFLSYSSVNKGFAIRLARELKSEGFNIWLDQLDIPAGVRWDREVEKALRESEIFMIILTPASVDSENVLDEIGYAIDKKKRFLPVLLENCEVPLRLRRFQYVDFTNKSFDDGVEAAKALLRSLIERSPISRAEATAVSDAVAEKEPGVQHKAERLATQKAKEEWVAKQKAEVERTANADAKRKAKEEAERLAPQSVEPKFEGKNLDAVPQFVPVTAHQQVAIPIPQKKSGSRGLLFVAVGVLGVMGIALLFLIILALRGISGGNNGYEPPVETEAPTNSDPLTEAPTVTGEPVTEEPVTEEPAVTPDPSIIFQSDFSDPENTDWGNYDCCYVQDGTYVMVMQDDSESWITGPKVDFTEYGPDVAVQTSVTSVPHGGGGVYCRKQNNSYYLFQVDFDESAAQIWYRSETDWNFLGQQTVTISDTYNHIYAVCEGNSLVFYWNGDYAIEATDDNLPDAGQAGLYAQTSDSSGSLIAFDDFYVTYP